MSAKIVYEDIAVGAADGASVTSSDADAISDLPLLLTGAEHPDIASLEMNSWGGNGKKKIYSGQDIALKSVALSGADCAFTDPPTFEIALASTYTTLGISFRFATDSTDYPTSLTIAWYQGATKLDEKTFTPDGISYFCENTVTAFDKIVVTINSMSQPNRYALVEQVIFGIVREFGIREIGSAEILQETNLLSAEIAIDTLKWQLKSATDIDYIFQLRQPMLVYNNSSLIGVFYIDDGAKKTSARNYNIPCVDALGVLNDYPFDALMYTAKNAVTALEEIVDGAFELEIDSSYSSKTLTGLNPAGTRKTAIQQIAFVLGAVVSTAGTQKIKIFPAPASAPVSISALKLYQIGEVEQSALITAVVIVYHTYVAGSGTSGDDVVTVGGVKYVHTTGSTRIDNPNVTALDRQNVKTVKDCTLINASNAEEIATRVYAYFQRRNVVKNRIVVTDETPADYVTIPTKWNSGETGNIESMKIILSNTVAADVKIRAVT